VNPLWATVIGQPCNSIIICRVQLGQATSQLYQQTGIDNVRHHLWVSTGTQVRVGLSPFLPAGTTMTLCSVEAIQERPLSSKEVKVSQLEFNVPFQHKYGYIRDKRSGVESYPYPVKEG